MNILNELYEVSERPLDHNDIESINKMADSIDSHKPNMSDIKFESVLTTFVKRFLQNETIKAGNELTVSKTELVAGMFAKLLHTIHNQHDIEISDERRKFGIVDIVDIDTSWSGMSGVIDGDKKEAVRHIDRIMKEIDKAGENAKIANGMESLSESIVETYSNAINLITKKMFHNLTEFMFEGTLYNITRDEAGNMIGFTRRQIVQL